MKKLTTVLRAVFAGVCAFGVGISVYTLIGTLNGSLTFNPELTATLTDTVFWSFLCLGMAGVYGVFAYGLMPKRIETSRSIKLAGLFSAGAMMLGAYYHVVYKSIIAVL